MRTCYISLRRVYKDRPDILVPGRYWYVPDDTPFLPVAHCLGSMNDWRNCGLDDPPIGEMFNPRQRVDGSPPQVLPLLRVAGDAEQLLHGELFDAPKKLSPVWAIPAACYVGPLQAKAQFLTDLSLTDRRTLCWLASIAVESYASTGDQAEDLVKAVMGMATRFEFFANDDTTLTPGCILAENDGFAMCVIAGTTHQDQWEAHVINAIAGPIAGIAGWKTTTNTFEASTVIRDRFNAFLSGRTAPTILVGHSWGGAIAQVLAARMHNGNPARPLKVLTYAAPKPGDAALATVINKLDAMRISHKLDAVPLLPPNIDTDFAYGLPDLVAGDILAEWNKFKHSRRQLILDDDGALVADTGIPFFSDDVPGIVGSLILGLPIGPYPRHVMIGYANLICGDEDPNAGTFPISPEAEELIEVSLSSGPCADLVDQLACSVSADPPIAGTHQLPRLQAWSWENLVEGTDSNHYRIIFSYPDGATTPADYTCTVTLEETAETITGTLLEAPTCDPTSFKFGFPPFVTDPGSPSFDLLVYAPTV